MNQPSAIETRIGALIAAYADRAPIEVDPMTVTRFAVSSRTSRWRQAGLRAPGRGLGFLLLALTALLTLLVGAIVAGQVVRRDPEDILVDRGLVEPFIGLPPDGAAPSTPETGELVFSFDGRVGSMNLDFHRTWVYADGRLIWKSNLDGTGGGAGRSRFGTREPTTAVIEQQLTPVGVELLRSEVMATARILGQKQVGEDLTEWGRPGVLWGGLAIGAGDLLLDATWSDPALPGRLANPASWLPPIAWADRRIGGYVPSRYAVCTWPDDVPLSIDALPARARTLLVANGTAIVGSGTPSPDCLAVTAEVAREVAAALDATGIRKLDDAGVSFLMRDETLAGEPKEVRILPIVPHGEVVCSCG